MFNINEGVSSESPASFMKHEVLLNTLTYGGDGRLRDGGAVFVLFGLLAERVRSAAYLWGYKLKDVTSFDLFP